MLLFRSSALSGVVLAALAWAGTVDAQTVRVSAATSAGEADLVDVSMLAPGVVPDMRYASAYNFTGAPVPGYTAPICLLLSPAARALAQVQADLKPQGMKLKLFDCYRPVRAVKRFMDWVNAPSETRTKLEYHPHLEKAALPGRYIASTSGHSRGATVDLTLLRCNALRCEELDMGTPFDFFDPRANTDSALVGPMQRQNRQLLLQAMSRRGFVNDPMEWWHFTLRPEPTPGMAYDVPVE